MLKLRRILKILLIGFSTLAVVIVIGGFLLYKNAVYTVNINEYPEYNHLPLHTWAQVDLSDKTQCSDGSDYYLYTRRGDSSNLLIHFAGGGAAWDAETSSEPISITHLTGYYFPFIWEIIHATLDGIFKQDSPDNPFRDWSEVYIPYCTADFDIGAASPNYTLDDGSIFTIHHNGRQNVTEAMDWVFETFQRPDKVLISGESAGGFATVFWTPTVAQHYTNSDIYQLADGVYLNTPLWPEIVNKVWQADILENFGFEVSNDIAATAFLYDAQTAAPNVTYLHINTVYDQVLLHFNAKLNNVTNDSAYRENWSQELRASMRNLATQLPNYYFYLTDYELDEKTGTTPHTSISSPLFYQITKDTISLPDWLKRIIIDGERLSVGGELLQ